MIYGLFALTAIACGGTELALGDDREAPRTPAIAAPAPTAPTSPALPSSMSDGRALPVAPPTLPVAQGKVEVEVGRVSASFFNLPHPNDVRVQQRIVDGCVVGSYAMSLPPAPEVLQGEPKAVSAGSITLSGGGLGGAFVLDPNPVDSSYSPRSQSSLGVTFVPGDVISLRSDGATVPAFAASAVAPAVVTITEPSSFASPVVVIDPSQDLLMSWTGGTTGQVLVYLGYRTGDVGRTTRCLFPATARAIRVPRSALAGLRDVGGGELALISQNDTMIEAGDFTVLFSLHGGYVHRAFTVGETKPIAR